MNASAFYHPERVRELNVEIIDMKVISTLEGLKDEHDRDFIVAQIELFNKWVPIYINDIKEALFLKDFQEVLAAVRNLRASGGALGAQQLCQECQSFEELI